MDDDDDVVSVSLRDRLLKGLSSIMTVSSVTINSNNMITINSNLICSTSLPFRYLLQKFFNV